MEKQYILDHVDYLPAEQLAEFISRGIVSLDELRNTGDLDASKARQILALLKKTGLDHDNSWNNAQQTNTADSYEKYLADYPNGINATEARNKIVLLKDEIAWQDATSKNTKSSYESYCSNFATGNFVTEAKNKIIEIDRTEKVINDICENPNKYSASQIRNYLEKGLLTRTQLENKNIPSDVIDKLLSNPYQPNINIGERPTEIPNGFTEVYFWGIAGSGKTTALAAIMSAANRKGLIELAKCPGFNYMLQLQNMFQEKIAMLPRGNAVDETQYLPFTLKKESERNARSISLIELSGEVFQCFSYKMAGETLPTEHHQETFDLLVRFLQSNNRKLHFFFIDYDKDNKPDQDGKTQADYLNAAATFFNLPENNFFKKSTNGIYIVLTKSDLMPDGNKVDQIIEYLNSNNYKGFVNSLKAKCVNNHISSQKLIATPFSLGDVYFKDYCQFNDNTALNIIDILLRRVPQTTNTILNIFNK